LAFAFATVFLLFRGFLGLRAGPNVTIRGAGLVRLRRRGLALAFRLTVNFARLGLRRAFNAALWRFVPNHLICFAVIFLRGFDRLR
jgi:hypothetical protein